MTRVACRYADEARWAEGYNRMITVLFYLSTVEEGGETVRTAN
jgi:hypothetical protein